MPLYLNNVYNIDRKIISVTHFSLVFADFSRISSNENNIIHDYYRLLTALFNENSVTVLLSDIFYFIILKCIHPNY